MTIRRLICAFSMILGVLSFTPAFADPTSDYEYCLMQGKQAMDRHDDAEAARYFKMARSLNPLGDKPYKYLQMIEQRQALSGQEASPEPSSLSYEDLMKQGQEALARGDRQVALDAFYKALVLNKEDPRPLEYINLIKRLREDQAALVGRMKVVAGALDQYGESALPVSSPPSAKAEEVPSGNEKTPQEGASSATVPTAPAAQVAAASSHVPVKKTHAVVDTILLSDVLKEGTRPTILLDLGGSLILEGHTIQRFLVMDPAAAEVKTVSRDQIQIKALKRGSTFIHIWDDAGRSTIYLEIVLPQASGDDLVQPQTKSEHARPFRLVYSNDWGTYYYGDNIPDLERRSLSVQQGMGLNGETPYGDFDASGSFTGYGSDMKSTTYTMGLSQIPLPGTSNFNVRIFDAKRDLSPLTLSGVRLRGAFADTFLFRDILGLSLTHGRLRPLFGDLYGLSGTNRKVYADAVRLTLFPKDRDNQISLNYAKGYGADREEYLTDKAYSIEGRKKIDKVSLSGELARDQRYTSSLAGVEWADGQFRTGVNFRDINKNYTTVTNAPSGQGEIGGVWRADANWEKVSADSTVDVFQDTLNPNPNNPSALNYDTSAHVHVPLDQGRALDTNIRYVDTSGQVSTRRFNSQDVRISQSFDVWGGRKGTVYTGASSQRSRYANAPASEYDRCAMISGVQVPLTKGLSCYANYEYSWLHEPDSGLHSNPNVFNAGLNYNREFTQRLNGTLGVAYRNEEDVRGVNSFLAGEDSLMFSSGLSFTPIDDINVFLDGRLRNVWAQIPENPSYNDLDVRVGMRVAIGTSLSWDPKGGVSGFVFKDKNGDGRFTVGKDEGVPGVKVKVGDQEVLTNDRGWYRAGVRAKRVAVAPVLETIPPGFIFSTPATAEVDIFQGISKRVDFGLTTQSGIYGVVFVDKNGNGIPDKDDQFVGRVMFILDGKVRQLSDSRGAYFFKNVSPGKHTVSVDMHSLPIEFIPVVKLKSDVNVSEGTTYILHIPLKEKPPVLTAPPQPSAPTKE